MTDDGFRHRFDPAKRSADLRSGADKPAATGEKAPTPAGEGHEESFSLLSADRQQKVMVEFRFKDGNAKALAYSYLVAIDFDKSGEIAMDFAGYDVRISGRNLEALFAGLVAQRVASVKEVDALQAEAISPEDATVVTGISVNAQDES